MGFWSKSLMSKLVGYFSLLSLMTVVGVSAIAFWRAKISIQDLVFERLQVTANLKEATINLWLENQKEATKAIAQSPEIRSQVEILATTSPNSPSYQAALLKLKRTLESALRGRLGLKNLSIIHDFEQKIIFSTDNSLQGQKLSETIHNVHTYQTQIHHLYISPITQQPTITISTPIKGEYSEYIGFLTVDLNLEQMRQILLSETDNIFHSNTYIISPDHLMLSEEKYLLKLNSQQFQSEGIANTLQRQDGKKIYLNYQQIPVIGVYRWLDHLNLGLLIEIPRNQALAPARHLAWTMLGVGAIFAIFLTIGVYIAARRITRPILAIKDTVLEVVKGDLNAIAPVLSQDELGVLAEAFNQLMEEVRLLNSDFDEKLTQLELAEIMAQQSVLALQNEKQKLEETQNKLAQANQEITLLNERLQNENLGLTEELKVINQRLNQFLDAIPVGIIVLDAKGKIYYANNKAKFLLGTNLSQINHVQEISDTYPIYISNSDQVYPLEKRMGFQSLNLGKSVTTDDIEIHHQQRVIPIETWETPIFNDQGKIDYAIIAFQDITERKQAEREKQHFTEQLLKLNEANQRFVPKELLQILGKNSIIDVELGDNVQQEMTVLFSDIRGFTSLSERMNPEDNFKFINAYLSRMSPAIREHNGFIDKYIGDAIMALFTGADDAVQASIAMLKRLNRYNRTRQRPDRPPLRIGIGINTGLMRLGIVGGKTRIEGTVISDAVNLAARIEECTKLYQVSLLISQHTFVQLQNVEKYQIRIIDRVKVYGKSEEISVYEVFDADFPELRKGKSATKTIFEQALLLYHLNYLQDAEQIFQECLRQNPQDSVTQIYLERCHHKSMHGE